MYIVIAELNEAEIFSPSMLAQNAVAKSAVQYWNSIPFISRIGLAINRNRIACKAEIIIKIVILENR